MPAEIELHLRVRVRPGGRGAFLEFLQAALPFYESPGGIRVSLLQDETDENRFIELVRYTTRADYERDQLRVQNDLEMGSYLERWRALLAEPPQVEVYRRIRIEQISCPNH
jgi:quinol monooxygenase YgiN